MFKLLKGLLALVVIATISSVCVMLYSCQSEAIQDDNVKVKNDKAYVNLLNAYDSYIKKFVTSPITTNAQHRAKVAPGSGINPTTLPKDDEMKIYVKYPEGTATEIKNLYYYIENIQDMETLERLTAAEYTTVKPTDKDSIYCLKLSEQAIRNELSPLLSQSIDYLKAKGLTDYHIQQMLKAYHADENVLIPFALVLADYEMTEANKEDDTQAWSSNFNPLNMLCTPVYASVHVDPIVFDCALQALGIDILAALGQSSAKQWSIRVISKAFGTVAKKVIGPIGAAITVVSFGLCLREHDCIYEVVSPIETRFNELNKNKLNFTGDFNPNN